MVHWVAVQCVEYGDHQYLEQETNSPEKFVGAHWKVYLAAVVVVVVVAAAAAVAVEDCVTV